MQPPCMVFMYMYVYVYMYMYMYVYVSTCFSMHDTFLHGCMHAQKGMSGLDTFGCTHSSVRVPGIGIKHESQVCMLYVTTAQSSIIV